MLSGVDKFPLSAIECEPFWKCERSMSTRRKDKTRGTKGRETKRLSEDTREGPEDHRSSSSMSSHPEAGWTGAEVPGVEKAVTEAVRAVAVVAEKDQIKTVTPAEDKAHGANRTVDTRLVSKQSKTSTSSAIS